MAIVLRRSKKCAIVHALGLLVGLKPTDETDSIMYNRYYTPNWSSFSDTDKSDLMSKYPLCCLWILGAVGYLRRAYL